MLDLALIAVGAAMLVVSYLYRRTHDTGWNIVLIWFAVLKTQIMLRLAKRKAKNALPVKPS